jgi:hypothetical protein
LAEVVLDATLETVASDTFSQEQLPAIVTQSRGMCDVRCHVLDSELID